MDLLLWRHAEAIDSTPDHARALTEKGIKQAEKMAGFLRQHLSDDCLMLSSPALRAQQTISTLSNNVSVAPALAPGASVQDVLQTTHWPSANGMVLVAGHQPTLGQVAAHLLDYKNGGFKIKKGAVWWFNRREGSAQTTLRLVISPDLL